MAGVALIVNGHRIEPYEGHEVTQTYRGVSDVVSKRMQGGRLVTREHWRAIATSLSGTGWLPPALLFAVRAGPFSLHCVQPMEWVIDASLSATLPTDVRTDVAPRAYALLADGERTLTPLAMAGRVATVTAVAGALGYLVVFWPVLTVIAPWPELDGSVRSTRWTLDAQTTDNNLTAAGGFEVAP